MDPRRRVRLNLLNGSTLLRHECRHAEQYARCAGLPFLLLYTAATSFSRVVAGDRWSANPFELWAGLADGGYPVAPSRG